MKQAVLIILIIATAILTVISPATAAGRTLSAIDKKIDSLFILASSGMIMHRDMVQPAIDSIVALGADAVPRLVEKYDTQSARERHTIDDILVKIGSPAVPYLIESLALDNPEQLSRICYSLGRIQDTSAVPALLGIADHDDWQVRSGCVGALGRIGDNRADKTVIGLLVDEAETVRKSAAVSAGKLLPEAALPLLVHMLGDNFYGARHCASEALVKFGAQAIKPIVDSLDSDNPMLGNLGCTTLGMIGGEAAAFGVARQLEADSPLRRALAVEAIFASESSLACGLVELLAESETDSLVLYYIDRVLEKYAAR